MRKNKIMIILSFSFLILFVLMVVLEMIDFYSPLTTLVRWIFGLGLFGSIVFVMGYIKGMSNQKSE